MDHRLVMDSMDLLREARALRQARVDRLEVLFKTHGDHGSLISGVERDHFPTADKDWLRANAGAIGAAIDLSLDLWTKSGRRRSTWLQVKDGYGVPGSRY